ncbi:MAG TPA: hypothetical protein VGJ45_01080 [Pseudonocardiaceae bacterium]
MAVVLHGLLDVVDGHYHALEDVAPMREVLGALMHRDQRIVGSDLLAYFEDVHDDVLRITGWADSLRSWSARSWTPACHAEQPAQRHLEEGDGLGDHRGAERSPPLRPERMLRVRKCRIRVSRLSAD